MIGRSQSTWHLDKKKKEKRKVMTISPFKDNSNKTPRLLQHQIENQAVGIEVHTEKLDEKAWKFRRPCSKGM